MEGRKFHTVTEADIYVRPATLLIQVISKFNSGIDLGYSGRSINLKSIMSVVSPGVGQGADVTITANGNDAKEAIKAVVNTMKEGSLAE